eukprot:3280466-Rhodomonas_salina.1
MQLLVQRIMFLVTSFSVTCVTGQDPVDYKPAGYIELTKDGYRVTYDITLENVSYCSSPFLSLVSNEPVIMLRLFARALCDALF